MGQRELAGPTQIGSTGVRGWTAFLNLSGLRCQENGLEELQNLSSQACRSRCLRLGGAGSSHQQGAAGGRDSGRAQDKPEP